MRLHFVETGLPALAVPALPSYVVRAGRSYRSVFGTPGFPGACSTRGTRHNDRTSGHRTRAVCRIRR
jgi:hypothetical protein